MIYKIQYIHIHHGPKIKAYMLEILDNFKIQSARHGDLTVNLKTARALLNNNPSTPAYKYRIISYEN